MTIQSTRYKTLFWRIWLKITGERKNGVVIAIWTFRYAECENRKRFWSILNQGQSINSIFHWSHDYVCFGNSWWLGSELTEFHMFSSVVLQRPNLVPSQCTSSSLSRDDKVTHCWTIGTSVLCQPRIQLLDSIRLHTNKHIDECVYLDLVTNCALLCVRFSKFYSRLMIFIMFWSCQYVRCCCCCWCSYCPRTNSKTKWPTHTKFNK